MSKQFSMTRPDDWHLHLRDGDLLAGTVPATARQFKRAVIMPNLVPPVTEVAQALAYRERIMAHVPEGSDFDPLMALYLTQQTSVDTIREAAANPHVIGFKLYPAGATTNSASGVTDIDGLSSVYAAMAELQVPLLVHGEVTDSDIDIFDREQVFIDRYLKPLHAKHPTLKIILEHITTQDAVDFVLASGPTVAATITPQHLLMNRNDMLVGGIRPHHYCLPILKRRTHQQALQQAALSGNPKFFLGTDSAPHAQDKKEAACGCAGCYSAPAAIELYAHLFELFDAMDKFEAFASHFGADFYGLPRNQERIVLQQRTWQVPKTVSIAGQSFVPYWAGDSLNWKLGDD